MAVQPRPPKYAYCAISRIVLDVPGAPRDLAVPSASSMSAALTSIMCAASEAACRGPRRPARRISPPATTALRLANVPVAVRHRLGIAVLDPHVLDRDAERVGGDLGERGLVTLAVGVEAVRTVTVPSESTVTDPQSYVT